MLPNPLHPAVVHVPLALALVMPLLAMAVLLGWWRSWYSQRVWILVAALQVVTAAAAFVAVRSGGADEERVERVVAESYIEAHEEAADVFAWSSLAVAALAIAGFVVPGQRPRKILASLATLGMLFLLVAGLRVGKLGGELVYVHGAAQAHVSQAAFDRAGGAQVRGPAQPGRDASAKENPDTSGGRVGGEEKDGDSDRD